MNYPYYLAKPQRGIVLFVALVALVVMSLAAVALIRSVDTNTMITGNLSFKQSAVVSADRGVETALSWMDTAVGVDVTALEGDKTANGYFATFDEAPSPDLDDLSVLKDDAMWGAKGKPATGADITGGTESKTENTILYIIQRMCREPGEVVKKDCLLGDAQIGSGSKGVVDLTGAGALIDGADSPIYRVTVRVTGPKNTVSYTQSYVY